MPFLALLVGKLRPGEPDDLRESAVVGLYVRRDDLTLDKRGSEEDERILGSLNVILVALLRSSLVITGYRSTTPIRCLRGRGRR